MRDRIREFPHDSGAILLCILLSLSRDFAVSAVTGQCTLQS
jgi:hypothetical protein